MVFITQWFWKKRVRAKIHFQEEPSDSNSVHIIKNHFKGIVYSIYFTSFKRVEDIFSSKLSTPKFGPIFNSSILFSIFHVSHYHKSQKGQSWLYCSRYIQTFNKNQPLLSLGQSLILSCSWPSLMVGIIRNYCFSDATLRRAIHNMSLEWNFSFLNIFKVSHHIKIPNTNELILMHLHGISKLI